MNVTYQLTQDLVDVLELLARASSASTSEWCPIADRHEAAMLVLERRGLALWRRRFPAGRLEGKLTATGRKALEP